MTKYILPFFIAILFITSCQEVVDADNLLDTEEKIFIQSYISPQDTVFRVNVSRALPSIGTPLSVNDFEANEDLFLIKDAQVSISNANGDSTDLQYSEENKTYFADATTLAILANQDYFLKVTVDGNEYNASCSIPAKIEEINELINYRDDNYDGIIGDINISFTDIANTRNFYVLGGLVIGTYQFEQEEPTTYTFPLYFDSDEFQTDNVEDGGIVSGRSEVYVGNGSDTDETQIKFQVANVEEILFQNLRSSTINSENEGNPFVEYSIAPNNFNEDGAVGIFAGYQLTTKTIDIEL